MAQETGSELKEGFDVDFPGDKVQNLLNKLQKIIYSSLNTKNTKHRDYKHRGTRSGIQSLRDDSTKDRGRLRGNEGRGNRWGTQQ